ncbi:MAG: SH3 domain-containing protein [Dissulfurispiraceae bacterium]
MKFKDAVRDDLIAQIKNHQINNVFETYSALHYLDKQLKPEDKPLLTDVVQRAHYTALSEIASAEISELNRGASQGNFEQQVQTVKAKSQYKSVDVRAGPSMDKPVIESIPAGMEVLKIGENTEWVRVKLEMDDGSTEDGWLKKEMVDETKKGPDSGQTASVGQNEQQHGGNLPAQAQAKRADASSGITYDILATDTADIAAGLPVGTHLTGGVTAMSPDGHPAVLFSSVPEYNNQNVYLRFDTHPELQKMLVEMMRRKIQDRIMMFRQSVGQ